MRSSKIDLFSDKFREKIIELGKKGQSSKAIAQWIKQVQGETIHPNSITGFLRKNGVDNRKKAVKQKIIEESKKPEGEREEIETDYKLEHPVIVDVEKYKQLWDIPDKLDSPDKVIATIQKSHAEIHLLNSMIAHASLNNYIEGKTNKYPLEMIRGLQRTFDMIAKSWGLTQTIDVNAAMKTMESVYDIDASRLLAGLEQ